MFTVRDYQSRVNGIFKRPVLTVDGMNGPKTHQGIENAMKEKRVRTKQELFTRGVRGVVWHWTAGAYGVIDFEKDHYNFIFDTDGNTYDGNHTISEQVNYDWRKGIGASHTKSLNTGWLGCSVDAMGDAKGWPMDWGTYPLTWEGIDAMLETTAEICEEYDVPVSKWTILTHAEVQPTLGVKQNNKWDYMVLPGDNSPRDPVHVGDEMRKRMIKKFM